MRVASPWVWFTHEQALLFRETPWRLKTREPASPVSAAGLRGGPGSGPATLQAELPRGAAGDVGS